MIDPPPLMAGTDQSRQNMWRKMLNYAVHRNVPGACATYWSAPHTATACQVARPPARIGLGRPSPRGLLLPGFRRIGLPPRRWICLQQWLDLLLLAGLSPAGMAAS